MIYETRKPPLLACLGILLAITAGYQWFYCFASTSGDITGLFFSGTRILHPPALEQSGFHYRGSLGYDGQMYRMIAHDPFRKKGYWNYVDDSRLRGQRILIPLAAGLLGGDSVVAVDFWYVAIVDFLLVLGGICFVLLAGDDCPRLWALALYCIIPAVVASTDRMVLDGPSVAGFLAALWFYRQSRRLPLCVILVLLPFIREPNLAVNAGFVLVYLMRRRFSSALVVAATAIPGLVWLAYITTLTPARDVTLQLSAPLLPQVLRLFVLMERPLPWWQNRMMQTADFLAMAALLFTYGLFVSALAKIQRGAKLPDTPPSYDFNFDRALIILPTAFALAFVGGSDVLDDPYGFMRIDSLLITWGALHLLTKAPAKDRTAAQHSGLALALRKNPVWFAGAYLSACSIGMLIHRAQPAADFFARLWKA